MEASNAGATGAMTVTVMLFAQARERAGRGRLELEMPAGARVRDALDQVRQAHPGLAELWPHLATAVDGTLVKADAPLHDGAELALLPPVSGG